MRPGHPASCMYLRELKIAPSHASYWRTTGSLGRQVACTTEILTHVPRLYISFNSDDDLSALNAIEMHCEYSSELVQDARRDKKIQ